jgi:hypothetical protein
MYTLTCNFLELADPGPDKKSHFLALEHQFFEAVAILFEAAHLSSADQNRLQSQRERGL